MVDIKSYLPEFDNFLQFKRYHNRIKRLKNSYSKSNFEIAEDNFIQFVYQYYIHHGVDFLREQIVLQIDSIKYREVVNDYIDRAAKYRDQYIVSLEIMLEDMGELSYYDMFSQYCPLNGYTLKAFVSHNKDLYNLNEFAKIFAIAMCLMDSFDDRLNEYLQNVVSDFCYEHKYIFATNFYRYYIRFGGLDTSLFNEIYPLTSTSIKTIRGEISIALESQFLSDGDFYLPWNNVVFMDGYMFLYHPKYPDGGSSHMPLRHDDEKCCKALNNIKSYIVKRLQPIKVTTVKSRIVAIQNINQISEAVEYLNRTIANNSVKLGKKRELQTKRSSIYNQNSNDVLEKLKLYKNQYLEYLSEVSLVNYKVFYTLEARVNSSEICTTEAAFIFTLRQDQKHTLIIYENNLPARASVCFIINTECYKDAIDDINNFFSSNNVNKREMLMSNNVIFDATNIIKYYRVNHDDFNLWKLLINEI